MFISLQQAKKHLLVDADFKDDDSYIECLICVAEQSVMKHLNIGCEDYDNCMGCTLAGYCDNLPHPIIQAMLLLIGNLYANREPVAFNTVAKVPLSYEYLISLYKQY